jgi:cytochrome b6-f complex iron-sulfur subunit
MQRRVFLRVIAAATVAACGTPPQSQTAGPDAPEPPTDGEQTCAGCLDLADPTNATLTRVGGSRVVRFNNASVLVARTSETSFIALSAICTHAGCTVRFASTQISCPCHGSLFALDGTVTRGPATRPLARHTATYDPTTNIVTLS